MLADYGQRNQSGFCSFVNFENTDKQPQHSIKHLDANDSETHSAVASPVYHSDIPLLDSSGSLCEKCKEFDIDKIFAPMKRHSGWGSTIAVLGNIGQSSTAVSCALCRLFAAVRTKDRYGAYYCAYRLQRLSFMHAIPDVMRHALPRNIQLLDCICLAVIPDSVRTRYDLPPFSLEEAGLICMVDPPQAKETGLTNARAIQPGDLNLPQAKETGLFNARAVQPDKFNLPLVKQWIDFCMEHHKKCARNHDMYFSRLKVIDCERRSVVPAQPNCVYAALSYVWGSSNKTSSQHTNSNGLPGVLPKTINDAILVVQQLGWRYLWVDRYCIDQNNKNDKDEQIGRMGEIYAGSIITIIAAAGEDDDFGLPGVDCRRREPQPVARLGDRLLVSTLRRPEEDIHTSKWATRGWTYQEAVLSSRRLVFTPQQVYFECKCMNCCESVDKPLSVTHTRKGERFRAGRKRGYFESYTGGTATRSFGSDRSSIEELRSHIKLFSGREFSYEKDIMAAFSGILRHYENRQPPIHHLWGLPTSYPSSRNSKHPLNASLLWTHEDGVLMPVRNRFFPSFSWLGWHGVAILPANAVYESCSSCLSPTQLNLHMECHPFPTELIRFPIEYIRRREQGCSGFYVVEHDQPWSAETSLGRVFLSKVPSTNANLMDGWYIHTCEGFIVAEGEERPRFGEGKILFILVVERGENRSERSEIIVERVGVIRGVHSKLIKSIGHFEKENVYIRLQ
jgi:hypothetical protein